MAHQMSRRTSRRMARLVLAAIGVALISGAALAQMKTMSITTGGTGGVFYPLGGGLANILSKTIPGLQATAEVTGGSVDNLKLIGSGQSELAFTQADAVYDAVNGLDKFKSGKVALRNLMVLYPNQMHVVTIEGTGVAKVADLKGKRVSTGSPGSATEVMAFRVIEAAGLANSVVWNLLVTGDKMTDEMAYTIVKTIFDKQPDLIAVHREAENFSLKAQIKANSTAPWHPGALKYFAERGVAM